MVEGNQSVLNHIIHELSSIQSGKLWMGASYDKRLSMLTAGQGFIKPLPSVHSVAQILAHLTAWSDDLILKIKNGTGQLRDHDDLNWPANDVLQKSGWDHILTRYYESIEMVITLLKTKDDGFLSKMYYDQDFKADCKYSFAVVGLLQHNIYHLGQVGLIIKLLQEATD